MLQIDAVECFTEDIPMILLNLYILFYTRDLTKITNIIALCTSLGSIIYQLYKYYYSKKEIKPMIKIYIIIIIAL